MLSLAAYNLLRPLRLNSLEDQAQVYLARVIYSGELVVVKWLPHLTTQASQQLFYHEIAVLQHLLACQNQSQNHAPWLPLIATGQDFLLSAQSAQPLQKLRYMVMPYVAAGNLSQVLNSQSDHIPDLSELFWQLINAVELLHQCGWLHLDLKPSNILVKFNSKQPQVLLIDFAMARPISSFSIHNVNNQLIPDKMTQGTPTYMSPEQFLAQDLNQQTDYYALGLIFYQLLTQQLPFCISSAQGINSTQQWAMQHCQQPVPLLPVHLNCFQGLIDGLLAKQRHYRVQTMQEIKDLTHQAFLNFNA